MPLHPGCISLHCCAHVQHVSLGHSQQVTDCSPNTTTRDRKKFPICTLCRVGYHSAMCAVLHVLHSTRYCSYCVPFRALAHPPSLHITYALDTTDYITIMATCVAVCPIIDVRSTSVQFRTFLSDNLPRTPSDMHPLQSFLLFRNCLKLSSCPAFAVSPVLLPPCAHFALSCTYLPAACYSSRLVPRANIDITYSMSCTLQIAGLRLSMAKRSRPVNTVTSCARLNISSQSTVLRTILPCHVFFALSFTRSCILLLRSCHCSENT
jgi:hypothetical protein